MTDLPIELAGEQVLLLPERALYWPRQATLIAADLHWGKAASFRAAGVPIPTGTTSADLARLNRTLGRTGAKRLVLLGDLFHARQGRAPATLAAIARWRAASLSLPVLLVRGNHDRRAGDPPPELNFEVVDGPHALRPFVLRHEPGAHPDGYVLAGHIHPGITLRGPARQSVRLPCFALGAAVGLLPAFSEFTGTAPRDTRAGDRVFAIAGDEVMDVTGN